MEGDYPPFHSYFTERFFVNAQKLLKIDRFDNWCLRLQAASLQLLQLLLSLLLLQLLHLLQLLQLLQL